MNEQGWVGKDGWMYEWMNRMKRMNDLTGKDDCMNRSDKMNEWVRICRQGWMYERMNRMNDLTGKNDKMNRSE